MRRASLVVVVVGAVLMLLAPTIGTSVAQASVNRYLEQVVVAAPGPGNVPWYRIPAMAVVADGTIVTCYDSRDVTPRDLPNKIDIVCRHSTDGRSWSTEALAARHLLGDTPSTAYGVGDPNLTYDRVTRRLFLSYAAAPPGIGYFNAAPSDHPGDMATMHPRLRWSDNDGTTWSDPVDLTAELKAPRTAGIFASGGKGLQLTDGTLAVPYDYRIDGESRAAFATSTDHGTTWQMQAALGRGVGEHKGEQLANGTVIDFGRNDGGQHRVLSTAASPNGPWSAAIPRPDLPDPGCNGDILRVDTDPASPHAHWLLESNPANQHARSDLVVRLSQDDGASWTSYLTIEPGAAGYSTMARLPDGSFGILYEGGGGGSLTYAHFQLSQVESTSPVKQAYLDRGGSAGPLAAETALPTCGLAQGGCFQTYQNGAIYWSPTSGAHVVRGAIRARWAASGWERGPQGYPLTDETCGLAQGGCFQTYQNGAIYWSPTSGAHVVRGAIRARWAASGWERGLLGYPVTDEFCGLVNGGCGQHFSNGASIYWTTATGAHLVRGAIRGEWAATGWETKLGYPVTDEFCGLLNGGCGQHFSNGASIYWTPTTGAHPVTGAIRSEWAATGWERGVYGYPTGDAYTSGTNRLQPFQGGVISVPA